MELIKGVHHLSTTLIHSVITIGNFDGVHLGHREIINTAVTQARKRRGVSIAFTFRPHPQITLRPEKHLELLSTYDERTELISELGIDLLIEEPFSRKFSTLSPEKFFIDMLLTQLKAEAIVVGYDFAFGKERAGHLEALKSWSARSNVELTVVAPFQLKGEVVSSSRIRKQLLEAQVDTAARFLGRAFFYKGIVVRGEGRGHKIGYPTANIKPGNKLVLPYGVYATRVKWKEKLYSSVTNVGVRPTFTPKEDKFHQELPALVETHILDQDLDLYGSELEVQFVKRIREEKKFTGIEALCQQINMDVKQARSFLAGDK
jgi:riboflavin kinase / FMN adenylyltransferase